MVREHVLRLSRGWGMVNSRCLSPASRLRADPKEADAAAVAQAARLVGAAERRGQRRVVEEGWDRDGLLRRRLARCEDEPLHGCPASARGNASAQPPPGCEGGVSRARSGERRAERAQGRSTGRVPCGQVCARAHEHSLASSSAGELSGSCGVLWSLWALSLGAHRGAEGAAHETAAPSKNATCKCSDFTPKLSILSAR